MGLFVRGDVVIVPFPFSDLSAAKRRPALMLTNPEQDEYGDIILAQITSRSTTDTLAVEISTDDFDSGMLRQTSNVRPNKLFTTSESVILYKAGNLQAEKLQEILLQVVSQFEIEQK